MEITEKTDSSNSILEKYFKKHNKNLDLFQILFN